MAKDLRTPKYKMRVVKDKRTKAREKALDELAALSQELGLYD